MKLRIGPWLSLVVVGVVGACSDLETPAGVAAEDGGVPETSSPDAPVTPGNDAEVDASDAGTDSAADAGDAADADGGIVYAGNHVWSKLYGEPGSLSMSSPAMVPGPMGSVYISSNFSGTIDFGNGGVVTGPRTNAVDPPNAPNCYVTRIDKTGSHAWSKSFISDAQSDRAGCQVFGADASGVYILIGFTGTRDIGGGDLPGGAFIAKYAHTGGLVWSTKIPGASGRIAGLAGGDVVLFDVGTSSPDYGGGALSGSGRRSFLARFSGATGTHVWSKQSFGSVEPEAVVGDANGNIIIGGGLTTSVDWGGGSIVGAGNGDVFVAKFTGAGALLWTKRAGGPNLDQANALAVNAAGDVYVTGIAQGTFDIGTGPITPVFPTANFVETVFVAKISAGGAALWARVLPTNGADVRATGRGIATDPAGNVIVTGGAHCGLDFGGGAVPGKDRVSNWFLAKLSPTGAHLWSKGWAGASGGGAGGGPAAVDTDGNTVVLGGLNQSAIDMGGGLLSAGGDRSVHVLAKFSP